MLKELADYADAHLTNPEPGFTSRQIRWCAELAADGRFLNVLPLGDGKRGLEFGRCPDMHSMNAGGRAHFLIETCQYIALLVKGGATPDDRTRKRHDFYVRLLRQAGEVLPLLAPIADLMADPHRIADVRAALIEHKAKPIDWMTWRIAGQHPHESQEIQRWWIDWRNADQVGGVSPEPELTPPHEAPSKGTMVCFLTGKPIVPLQAHPKIIGLPGPDGKPNSFGDAMAGFDKPAFVSFGLDKSAPDY